MARPASGSVRWNATANAWEVRVTLASGQRSKPIVMTGLPPCDVAPSAPPRGCACASCKTALDSGRAVSARMRNGAAVDAAADETVSEWYARYYKAAAVGSVGRKNRGKPQASVDDRRARFRTWVEPVIGHLPMGRVTSSDLRRVVQKLDEQIRIRAAFYEAADEGHTGRKPGMSAKTAQNVWSEVTNGFAEAVSSKLDELRILEGNPAIGVLAPSTADDREQAALFPSEVTVLLSCEAIPLARRRLYAVAIYTGMRRSELGRLEATDVDLEHEIIRVRGKKTTAAKRTIPIEPSLRPLLEALIAEEEERVTRAKAEGGELAKGPLLAVPRADGKGGASDLTKRDLERAGLTRRELTLDDAEHMPFTFHGLRHTAITHWTVAGRDQLFLLTAAGHTDVTMTRRYLAAAASLSAKFGQPHPPLPPVLIGAAGAPREFWSNFGVSVAEHKSKAGNPEGFPAVLTVALATPAGIEPALPA